MKLTIKSALTVICLSLLVQNTAHAQDQNLIALDTNSDGKVSLSEFEKYVATKLPNFKHIKAFVKNVDTDANNQISLSEYKNRLTALRKTQNQNNQPSAQSPGATILLITSDTLAPAWQEFAHWKTLNGKATKIITIPQIQKNYTANNIQEKIRLCVRDHIDNHKTKWVILGGDSTPQGGTVPGGHTTVHAQEPKGIPTDIIYISKTNWDADGDGIYGEFNDDKSAISYPDGSIGLGRIPVRTPQQVKDYTQKIIAYESNYPTTNFAKQMVYTCTDNPAYPKVIKSWDTYLSKAWPAGSAKRFFSEKTPWDKTDQPGSYPLSANNLVGLINNKSTGKLHIHGHGLLPIWVLERSTFNANHVAKLKNKNAYPLITTVSCFTGEYDSNQDPSIVESMIRQPNGGSVAIVAPIRTGKAHFHKNSDFRLMVSEGKLDGTTQTMTRYWENGLGKGQTTGQALMTAKSQMIPDAKRTPGFHLCICEINLLGDPTLDMRANQPKKANIKTTAQIKTGKQNITIKTDAPNSTICLWKQNDIYQVTTTDHAGNATLTINPKSKGKLNITITGQSLNASTKKITVN